MADGWFLAVPEVTRSSATLAATLTSNISASSDTTITDTDFSSGDDPYNPYDRLSGKPHRYSTPESSNGSDNICSVSKHITCQVPDDHTSIPASKAEVEAPAGQVAEAEAAYWLPGLKAVPLPALITQVFGFASTEGCIKKVLGSGSYGAVFLVELSGGTLAAMK